MANIDITRTELVWPGKYNEDGTLQEVPRVSLPFQVIETVNESHATRELKKDSTMPLFDVYTGSEGDTFEEGWKNKLIWGDNLLVMGSLLEKFAGKIDLVYIDPPFATGADFSFSAPIGEAKDTVFKEQSVIEEKIYRDTWGSGLASYLTTMVARIGLMRDLLSSSGSLLVHVDYRVSHYLKIALDTVFGNGRMINEIIWHYRSGGGGKGNFGRKHDTLLFFSKSEDYYFDDTVPQSRVPHDAVIPKKWADKFDDRGKLRPDVWDISRPPNHSAEWVGFPTQKPLALLDVPVAVLSPQGGLVADFFCGSGTTLVAAERLGRRWIGCDLGRWGIHVTRKRLLGTENCKPFEVLNLGKYERQYWQGVTFGSKDTKPVTEHALYEYLSFILKLYGAQPLSGLTHLHGKRNHTMVHIGSVDAPVTIDEIDAAVDECRTLRQKELHVLGWEWEMGLYDLIVDAAKAKGVKLLLLQIPREVMEQQAADKGDVRFFELAYLEAAVERGEEKLTAQIMLKDFVIPNPELIPDEVRNKITKWSDYIDYWAVDWDFRNDTFMQGWVAYRTRKERKLPLATDRHTYERAASYRVLVKVVDIFGNDTSQAFDVEMR